MESSDLAPPIVCSLDSAGVTHRLEEWRDLLAHAEERLGIPGGLRILFPRDADLASRLARLAVLEQTCCGFLSFTELRHKYNELETWSQFVLDELTRTVAYASGS